MEENTATITEPTAAKTPTSKWDLDYKGFQGQICVGRYGLYIQLVGKNARTFSIKLTAPIKAAIIEQAKQRLDTL